MNSATGRSEEAAAGLPPGWSPARAAVVDEMTGYLRHAGFVVEEVTEREPYADVEAATRRAYVMASVPPPA